jgi:hypothetical protein
VLHYVQIISHIYYLRSRESEDIFVAFLDLNRNFLSQVFNAKSSLYFNLEGGVISQGLVVRSSSSNFEVSHLNVGTN